MGTRLFLLFARRHRLIATPGARSSHAQPTPHGGGVAVCLALLLGVLAAAHFYGDWPIDYLVVLTGGLLLTVLGVLDDMRGLSVPLRMACYGLVCVALTWWLAWDALPGSMAVQFFCLGAVSLSLLWLLNLYNFMDGIDGLAASQAVLACGSAALLSIGTSELGVYGLFCLLLAAAHLGFLVWNWPPAKLFLGDAGSVPTGLMLGALAILGEVRGEVGAVSWLILLAVFIADATWTLFARALRGERITQAHCSHLYQRLSRYWSGHRPVLWLFIGVQIAWLMPLAALAQQWPEHALILVILAYLPLLWGMARLRRLA